MTDTISLNDTSQTTTNDTQNVIRAALASRIEEMANVAHGAFHKLWLKDGEDIKDPDHDDGAGHNLYGLFRACLDLADGVKKLTPRSTEANNTAQLLETYWNRISDGKEIITPLAKYFGDEEGKTLTSELKNLFAAGIAIMRGEEMGTAQSDRPSRPALPKKAAFINTLSRRLSV